MKPIQSFILFSAFSLFLACKQNAPAPPPSAPAPDAQNMPGNDGNDGNGTYVSMVQIEDAGPVVRDPQTTTYLVERRKDGDLFPIFMTKTVTKVVGGKKTVEGPFSLTAEAAAAAIALMEKIGAIKEAEYKPEQMMVGAGPKTFTVARSNASSPNRITVLPGSKPDASLGELEKLAAAELAGYSEFVKGPFGKVATFLEGKVWQSDSDKNRRISFREGRLVTWHGDKEDPAKPYVSLRRWCPDGCGTMTKKNEGDGMKAGFICCMTLTAQDDECFLILDASGNKLEYAPTHGEDRKSESFTLLTRK